jgi:hypothetical protein
MSIPDSVSQARVVSDASGCGANVLATRSAVQCFPSIDGQLMLILVAILSLTKIWRVWIRDILKETFRVFQVALIQTNSDG